MKDKNLLFIFLTSSTLKLSAGTSYKAKKTRLELDRTDKTCEMNPTQCEKKRCSDTGNRTRACWVRASYPNP